MGREQNIGFKWVFVVLFILVGGLSACIKDSDFSTPEIVINPPEINEEDILDIGQVKGYFLSNGERYSFKGTGKYMEAYIVSSDEGGNFYQEMVLQDAPTDPTVGIKFLLQLNPLFTKYEIGRKIYLKLDGLTIGESNGMLSLGIPLEGTDFVQTAPVGFEENIIRSEEIAELEPRKTTIDEILSGAVDNLFVTLDSLQFLEGELGKTFAAEEGEKYDADRVMEGCAKGEILILLNDGFSSFKALKVPVRMGNIQGLVQKTFNGSSYRLKINDPSDIHFNEERCEPRDEADKDPEEEIPDPDPEEGEPEDTPPISGVGTLAFPGGDFENWSNFLNGLDKGGLQSYATEVPGKGIEESAALYIETDPTTTKGNDYVFKTYAYKDLPQEYSKLTFYLKGKSTKSLSINLYVDEKDYYHFNLEDIYQDKLISHSGSNRYSGDIDTNGKWVQITLDLSDINDLNTANGAESFFALKIGKEADYDLYLDEFVIE